MKKLALDYKIGQLRIAELQSRVEKALRGKFDIRAFHDELLADRALTLDLTETKMENWITRKS